MAITRVKSSGWGTNEKLTSAQATSIDINAAAGLDRRSGQTDTCASWITWTGNQTVSAGTWTFGAGSTWLSSGTVTFQAGTVTFEAGADVTFDADVALDGAVNVGGQMSLTENLLFTRAGAAMVSFPDNTGALGAVGHGLVIRGQRCTGLGSTGGYLTLQSGSGTTSAGSVIVVVGTTTAITATPSGVSFQLPVTWDATAASGVRAVPYAATITLDMSTGNEFDVGVLTGNTTITLTNVVHGAHYTIKCQQDGTGGRAVTLVGSGSWFTRTNIGDAQDTVANRVNIYELTGRTVGLSTGVFCRILNTAG